MKRIALILVIGLATALSSCAARVVTYPVASAPGTIAAQSNGSESGGGSVPVDPDAPTHDFIEPVTPENDPSALAEGMDTPTPSSDSVGDSAVMPGAQLPSESEEQERSVASGTDDGVASESATAPAVEPPAFLAERPAGEHSGPVPILIDAPNGSTATYSLDRNDPVSAPMSFVIDDVRPGDHVLEIVVQYPNGDTVTLEHHWTQLPEQTEQSGTKEEKKKKRRKDKRDSDSSEKRKHKKDREEKSKEAEPKEAEPKEAKSKEDASSNSGKK